MDAPFQLAAGLRLENAHLVLPWDSTMEKLALIGHPEVYKHTKATNLLWKNEAVLGGLAVSVQVMTAAGANAFYLDYSSTADSAQSEYAQLLKALSERLGSPHSSTVKDGYPWIKWLWGDVGLSLRIDERFTDYVSFVIAKGLFRAGIEG